MKCELSICTRVLLILSSLSYAAYAQPGPPDAPAYLFGVTVDNPRGNTVVAANSDWLWLWYAYNGVDSKMPPPGCVKIGFTRQISLADVDIVEFQLNGGNRIIHAHGLPYLWLSLSEALEIANANQIKVSIIHKPLEKNDGYRREQWINATSRKFIRRMVTYGKNWQPPEAPWNIGGEVGFIIDTRPVMKSYLPTVQKRLLDRVKQRQSPFDNFCLFYTTTKGMAREPHLEEGAHGIALFMLAENPYTGSDAEKAKKAIAALSATQTPQAPLVDMLGGTLGQNVKSIIYFTTEGPTDFKTEEIVEALHEKGARLFVVWMGQPAEKSKRWIELKEVTEQTKGGFVLINDE